MKKIVFFLILSMVTNIGAEAQRHSNRRVTISIQSFYDELSPFGDWFYTPEYGYVWQPYFDNPEGFRPYSSNGDWVYTEYGWTWVSDYRWGWAPFHYGRWTFDDYIGWMWVPGYEWAPAWVSWGSYGDCWGWAPLGPGININVNLNWFAPDLWWTFVPRVYFGSGNWHSNIYDRPVHATHITNITNIYYGNNNRNRNSNSWYSGPRVKEVESYNRSKVRTMKVVDSERPENLGTRDATLNVYRPGVDNSRADARPQEYRKMESTRGETKVQRTNPRTNDPGINRTREERNKPRTGTSVERNTSQPTVKPVREATRPEKEARTNETTRPVVNPTVVTKPENRERNSTPANENANRNTNFETKGKQATEAKPAPERETKKATSPERKKSGSTTKKSERKSSGEQPKSESSGSSSRK